MSNSKPAGGGGGRDTLGEFIALMNTANGREKLYRGLQYFVKFLKWREESGSVPEKDTLVMFDNIYRTLSLTRKLLRFFRWLAIYREIVAALPANGKGWDLETALNISSKVFLALYFLFDHTMYAVATGVWAPPPSVKDRFNRLTEGSWVGEIVSSLLYALLKLAQLRGAPNTPDNSLAFWRFVRAIVRNGVDLPVALHFLGFTGTTPHGYFGALGTVSSLISLWEMWPVIPLPAATAVVTAK